MDYLDILFYVTLGILLTYVVICLGTIVVSLLIDLGYYAIDLLKKDNSQHRWARYKHNTNQKSSSQEEAVRRVLDDDNPW